MFFEMAKYFCTKFGIPIKNNMNHGDIANSDFELAIDIIGPY